MNEVIRDRDLVVPIVAGRTLYSRTRIPSD